MKLYLLFLITILFSISCNRQALLSVNNNTHKQIIGLQPLDDYNTTQIDSLIKNISQFYNKEVILLPPITIPGSFFNGLVKQYNADSIIMLLTKLRNDTLVEIIGLTQLPLFTFKEVKLINYFDERILGIGYQPGNACVVSDLKFSDLKDSAYIQILKKVIIHEVGHNLGLPHCYNEKCIMFKDNGNISVLDKCNGDYCGNCRKILHWPKMVQ